MKLAVQLVREKIKLHLETKPLLMEEQIIYIFDDDEELLDLCSLILRKKGFKVHISDNCSDIILKVKAVQPNVILMDNWIPDTGGVKATQLLKADPALRDIPVVFFSANNDVPALAAEAGADAFITKPFDISDLEATILRLAETKASV